MSAVSVQPRKGHANGQQLIRYRTRWGAWTWIGLSFAGCLLAAWLRGGAAEWLGVYIFSSIIFLSGVLPLLSVRSWTSKRRLTAEHIHAGDQAGVQLELERSWRNPFIWVVIEEKAVHLNGMSERHIPFRRVLVPMFHRKLNLTYTLQELTRGQYALSPMTITVGDWLGLTAIRRTIGSASEILVRPAMHLAQESSPIQLAVHAAPIMQAGLGPDTRPYREGDSLRHLDFRSAARGRGLRTKEHRLEQYTEAIVLIDQYLASYQLDNKRFDTCISMALQHAIHSSQGGRTVRVGTSEWTFSLVYEAENEGEKQLEELHARLAKLSGDNETMPSPRMMDELSRLRRGDTLHVFSGDVQVMNRWSELASYVRERGIEVELYVVTAKETASYGMHEQQQQFQQQGITLNWLPITQGEAIRVPADEGENHYAIS